MGMITKDFIDEFRRFADTEVHPVVSPDNWHIYSRLIDFIDELDESLKEREPVEPVVHPETKYHYEVRDCGACGYYLSNGANYCPRCGRAVKKTKRSGDLNEKKEE